MTETSTIKNKKTSKHIRRALDDTIQLAMRIAEVRLAQEEGSGLDIQELAGDLEHALTNVESWKAKKKLPKDTNTKIIWNARQGAIHDATELLDEVQETDDAGWDDEDAEAAAWFYSSPAS